MTKNVEPFLISIGEACRLTSLSRSSINKLRATGHFPKAVPLGEKRIAFVRAEVMAWIEQRIESRGKEAA